MKKISIIMGTMAVVVASAVVACNSSTTPSANTEGIAEVKGMNEETSNESLIRRGSYLVTIMGCNDCHSPKIMTPRGPQLDSAHLLSGHPSAMPVAKVDGATLQNWVLFNHNLTAFVGPWGVSFAANLTSDDTGIGTWTEAQFFKAMREGKSKGMDNNRPLLPPMPWQQFAHATDEDLRAIFAYLKSTPGVENRVPAPIAPDALSKMN